MKRRKKTELAKPMNSARSTNKNKLIPNQAHLTCGCALYEMRRKKLTPTTHTLNEALKKRKKTLLHSYV